MKEILMDKTALFGTDVYIFKFQDKEQLKYILEKSLEMGEGAGVQKSNVGGWQGDNIFLPDVFPELATFVLDCMQKVTEVCKPCKIYLHNSWININEYRDSNLLHRHPGVEWASCFYVKMPGGSIVFEDPRIARCMEDFDLYREDALNTSTTAAYTPQEGDLVIFPAWLGHFVEPHGIKGERRVTIPTNIKVVLQGKEKNE